MPTPIAYNRNTHCTYCFPELCCNIIAAYVYMQTALPILFIDCLDKSLSEYFCSTTLPKAPLTLVDTSNTTPNYHNRNTALLTCRLTR